MRHKDVRRCAFGAFGFYLLFRFHRSGEMDDEHRPNFAENKDWFDIKILSDGEREHNTKELQRRTYTDKIKSILKELKIMSSHFGHWGRVTGPVELEFEEVPPELIRILGKSLVGCCVFLFVSSSHFLSCVSCPQVIGTQKHKMRGIPRRCLRLHYESLQGFYKGNAIV
jgi:hypothetical protein